MENILVSVLVITYNHEKYIKKALNSILMQKVNFKYEILIGDDASTDNTVKILKEYQRKNPDIIRLFLNKNNLGATRNSYNILIHAKGDYLATCEGDDYWTDENKLQIQVDFLEKHKELVGCTHKFLIVDEEDKPLKNQYMSWIRQKERFSLDDFQGMFLPGQPSTFMKRNILKLYNTDISCIYKFHRQVGDKTMMLLCLLNGDFGFLDRNMSAYRKSYKSVNSITGKILRDKAKFLKEDYIILCNFENLLKSKGKNMNMDLGKKIIFSKALAYCFFTLKKEYWDLVKQIWKGSCVKYDLIFYCPFYWWHRVKALL